MNVTGLIPVFLKQYDAINKRVDWSERDIISSSLINDVLSQGQYSMSLTSLDALLGGHGWLLKYRDKLPMTMILLRKMELIK